MTDHDRLCPWDDDEFLPGRQHCECDLIARARADERERLAWQAATVTITRADDGALTYSVDDPNGVGWVPVSLDLVPTLAANSRAVFDLRNRVLALHPDWLGTPGDVLALIDGADR